MPCGRLSWLVRFWAHVKIVDDDDDDECEIMRQRRVNWPDHIHSIDNNRMSSRTPERPATNWKKIIQDDQNITEPQQRGRYEIVLNDQELSKIYTTRCADRPNTVSLKLLTDLEILVWLCSRFTLRWFPVFAEQSIVCYNIGCLGSRPAQWGVEGVAK